MTGRMRHVLGGALPVVLALVAWRSCGTHREVDHDAAASRGAAPSQAVSASLSHRAPAPRAPLPSAAPRPARSGVTLRASADAGDVGAQIDLGLRLARCITQGDPGYADAVARQYEAAVASDLPGSAWRSALLRQQRAARDTLLLEHADCVLLAESGIEPSHVWLERAARSGDIEAKVAYAERSLDEFVRGTADGGADARYVENLEEIVRRRDLARRWLADALRAGSVDALHLLARAYAGEHPLYPRDARQAAIHRHALALAQARLADDPDRLRAAWHGGPDLRADDGFGPADREAIDASAQRIYLQWFGPRPDGG